MPNDNEIQALEGIQHVRRRPGMYVGGTDLRALHHMVYETVDNSAEEAFIGLCDRIEVELRSNQEICIRDNSGGLPVEIDEEKGLSRLELILTQFGRKYDPDRHIITGGLHGVGLTGVNGLSEYLYVEVARDGYLWRQDYQAGIPQGSVEKVRSLNFDEPTGTMIVFRPDFSIMRTNEFDYKTLRQRCEEIAYLTGNLTVSITDKRGEKQKTKAYFAEEGLLTLLEERSQECPSPFPPFYIRQDVDVSGHHMLGVEMALKFTTCTDTQLYGFINTVMTVDGGTHVAGMEAGLLAALNKERRYDPAEGYSWRDIASGIRAAVSVRHPDPQFESPTKVLLMNPEIFGAVAGLAYSAFSAYLSKLDLQERQQLWDKIDGS